MRRVKHVIRAREKHPEWTLGYIAKRVGTSRENVWQILILRWLQTAATPSEKPLKVRRRRCRVCRKIMINPPSRGIRPPLHEGTCYFQYYYVKIVCDRCTSPFYRKKHKVAYTQKMGSKKQYCSRDCYEKQRAVNSGD